MRTAVYEGLTLTRDNLRVGAVLMARSATRRLVFVLFVLRGSVMRSNVSLSGLWATVFAGVFIAALILIAPGLVLASEPMPVNRAQPALAGPDLRTTLDDTDEVATLDAIHTALSQVADGATYVWHRNHGRLSAILQPTQSFKDASGNVCRHLVVMLMSGAATRKTEGIACRMATGRWQLDG